MCAELLRCIQREQCYRKGGFHEKYASMDTPHLDEWFHLNWSPIHECSCDHGNVIIYDSADGDGGAMFYKMGPRVGRTRCICCNVFVNYEQINFAVVNYDFCYVSFCLDTFYAFPIFIMI